MRVASDFEEQEESFLKWLRQKQEQFSWLKNASVELLHDYPNRTINVCPDGPKILVLPNVSDIIYCYTREQWIDKLWSDLRLRPFHYPIIILNFLIFLFGATGNVFVCLSVYRNHQLRNVTNYFIVNLAFADLLVIIICLPATVIWDLSLTWFFGTLPCKLIMFLQDVSISVSVLTLTAISIDRYYAICHPLKFKSNLNQAKRMIALIWLISLLIMTPDLIYLRAKQADDFIEAGLDTVLYSDCDYDWTGSSSKVFQFVKTILLYLVPFILMFCAHFRIMRTLQRASNIEQAKQKRLSSFEENNFAGEICQRGGNEREHLKKGSSQDIELAIASLGPNGLIRTKSERRQAGKKKRNRLKRYKGQIVDFRLQLFASEAAPADKSGADNRQLSGLNTTTDCRESSPEAASGQPPPGGRLATGSENSAKQSAIADEDDIADTDDEEEDQSIRRQLENNNIKVKAHCRSSEKDNLFLIKSDNSSFIVRPLPVGLRGRRLRRMNSSLAGPVCQLPAAPLSSSPHLTAKSPFGRFAGGPIEQEPGSTSGSGSIPARGRWRQRLRGQRDHFSSSSLNQSVGSLAETTTTGTTLAGFGNSPANSANQQADLKVTMHNKTKLESRRKAAKMLMAIVIMFGICYLPVHLINFLRQFIDDIPQTDFTSTISMLAHCVCYLNSAINPIIYNHMNSIFRAEFSKFLSCFYCNRRRTQINRKLPVNLQEHHHSHRLASLSKLPASNAARASPTGSRQQTEEAQPQQQDLKTPSTPLAWYDKLPVDRTILSQEDVR